MSRQSVGVTPFKGIIRWLYPEAVKAFDPCAAQHDKDYKTVDWSLGAEATALIDAKFHQCCIFACDNGDGTINAELLADAGLFYKVCRKWGRMRAALWRIGVRY